MSIKGWLGIVITWLTSLFVFFKFGKKLQEKENESSQSAALSDSLSRGYNAGSASVNRFRKLHSDK